MANLIYDTETCGLHGMAVLIQYAFDDGPINLHSVWTEPAIDTLNLIESFMDHTNIGFNLAFDHFHLTKLYTTLSLLSNCHAYPEDCIDEIARLEPIARDGQCLKPYNAMDLMLHARQGPFQSTMARSDIRIKKVPTIIAFEVRDELERIVKLDDIYFANRKDKLAPRWGVYDIDGTDEFKDIVLKFKASSALKNLAIHALNIPPDQVLRFGDIEVDKKAYPIELGYAPFALAISSPEKDWKAKVKKSGGWRKGYAWPGVIHRHISHWTHNRLARKYAEDDVTYTRGLWHFFGEPEPGDVNSELACMVAACRWRGYRIDVEKFQALRKVSGKVAESAPRSPAKSKIYIQSQMNEIEALAFEGEGTTKKTVLEEIATWEGGDHPAAKRASEVLDARQAKSEVDLFDKLIKAGRLHANFHVIGTLSSRMSGGGIGLNTQGIKRAKAIRSCFPLADNNDVLVGGDFISFEVVLADAVYNDPVLRHDLTEKHPCLDCNQTGWVEATEKDDPKYIIDGKVQCPVCEGEKEYVKKIHALFGMHVYPGMTYEEIVKDKEKYTRSKSAVFAMLYGGEAFTLKTRLGVDIEVAEKAYQRFTKKYTKVGEGRKRYNDMFCSMRQTGGIGTAIKWQDPHDYIESIFGFRRYFTLENSIGKTLFNLASKPPKHWKAYKGTVIRRDREQSFSGACMSALYAATFALQASNMRAAGNHVIQSSGAHITKLVQKNIWDLQPSGAGPWKVQPMNIHDEIMCPTAPDTVDKVTRVVSDTVESFRAKVPLIGIDWGNNLVSWAEK